MSLYLDNAATTKIKQEVLDEMIKSLEAYGNTEAKYYDVAEKAKENVKLARQRVAAIVGAKSEEIIFTSGATEANNLVIKGTVLQSKKQHKKVIISSIEHSSVYDTCKYLEMQGIEIVMLDVDRTGMINLNQLRNEIDDNTILVSIILVNNEIGTIQDIEEITKICEEKKVPLHFDVTQAVGKINIRFEEYPSLKFLTFTSHKIYGPKGVGCLVVKTDEIGVKQELVPLFHGGEQEDGIRAGTLSNELIVGFGKACEIARDNMEINNQKILELEKVLIDKLKNKFGDKLSINNDFDNRVHDILNVRIKSFNNMVLLKAISPLIAASTGSACSVSKPSRVLKSIGLSDLEISESIRLSMSPYMDVNELNVIDKL